ncbi:YfiR family protein [Ralstonia pseudosolanacearum]|uniref:YfiR family protein n=1 Tax=Ralstonia solanacearum TaxID=305 RepID=A0AA92EFH7_RALSL|nr:YfiR family protein [Ralstonia pseudosolanacearum]QCX51023.1 YfiR family protein [Ralstonia pseudosolanacearum]
MRGARSILRLSGRVSPRWLCAALGVACAAIAWMGAARAQVQASEVEVKAAFVYNFALFTSWPAGTLLANAPMVLCVAPDHALQAALGRLAGKSVHGHRLEVRRIGDGAVAGCHVAVLDDRAPSQAVRLDPAAPVLTVVDGGRVARAGGGSGPMIALSLQDSRVVFDIDAAAARQAGLQLSSQLLRLARSVQ